MDKETEIKQACIDLSRTSIAIFNLIDEKGILSPLDDPEGAKTLMSLVDKAEEIRSYYHLCNVQRLLALGVSPTELFRPIKTKE